MKRIHVHTARMLGLAMLVGVFGGACSGDSGNAHFDQCLPDVPADECYARRRDPESDQVALASEIALRYIDEQGRPFVTGISGPTDPWTFEEYAAVPLFDDLHFGVGAAILALIETSGLPE